MTAVLKLGPRVSAITRRDLIAMRVEQLRTLDMLGRAIETRIDGIVRSFVVRWL